MNFEDVIRNRKACRLFSENILEEEKLVKILEAGRLAPTARNYQPQKLYVVRDNNNLEKIDKVNSCRYNSKCVLIVCSNKGIAFSLDDYTTFEIDASIVGTHMMLEATNLGVDNVWCAITNRDDFKKELNIPDYLEPICMIPLGYKDDNCPESPNHNIRKDLSETVEYM